MAAASRSAPSEGWQSIEAAVDRWASLGALALAVLTAIVFLFLL